MSSAAGRRPRPSILSLDKSAEPFAAQLAQACSILEIDLDEHWKVFEKSADGPVLKQHTTFDPRAEWALRWLLKKLQDPDISPGRPRLVYKSWIMLQELTVRTPLTSVARLLSAHRFTNILRDTLRWLQQHVKHVNSSPDVEVRDEELLDLPEDSPDTVESSSSTQRTSKKRKVDGTEVAASGEVVSFSSGAFRVLYLAICGTVRHLQSLTEDPQNIRGFAVEHMKSSLRSSPEDAAHILGSSFYLTNRMIQTSYSHWHQKMIFTNELQKLLLDTGYRSCIFPAINLWSQRSLTGQHSSPSSDAAFTTCCMLPALQLLDTCEQRPAPMEEMAEVVKSLEELLVDHSILPLRDSFQGLKSVTELEKRGAFTSFIDNMVSMLRQYLPQLESPFLRAEWKTDRHLALSFISLLFDVAIRCHPRNTLKLRRIEDPWLEQLFTTLAKCAETLFPPASSVRSQKDHTRVIKWMLRKAVDHQVRLSVFTIQGALDQASSLFPSSSDGHTETHANGEDDNYIEWGLVSLCILNDADTFVIPSSSASDNGTYAYRPPNKYLSALFRNITDEVCYESLNEDEHYDFKLLHVITPLCDAFTGARDLPGFLEHWREQLNIVQERQESRGEYLDLVPSIWEDERLLLYVAQRVDSSLTTGQIERVLSTATRDLASSIPSVLSDQSMSLASLVVLDCVCTSSSRDETIFKLESKALSVFSLLEVLNSRSSSMSSTYGWRLWRIKEKIADRWSSLRDSSFFKRRVQTAICTASELISRISSELTLHDNVYLKPELYALRFLLKFAAMEDYFWEDLQFSSRSRISSAVMKLLDIMEPFCHRISHDHFGTMMRPDGSSGSEQSSLKISPIDEFYFECIDAIIEAPDTLSYFDESIQNRLVQQLYWSSVFQQRHLGSTLGASVDFSSSWTKLLRYDALAENEPMASCLRTFLVDRYLSTSDFGEPKYWDVEAADYVVAVRSIQATPATDFDRGQRARLANRVLRILLVANMSKLARITDHLILLAGLIQMPNKSIELLTNDAERSKKGSTQPKDEAALISLARRIDGVVGWSEDNVHSVRALRQLARLVMSYLFSTLDQKSSIQYLQTFYAQMAHSLEYHYKNNNPCTTAFSALFEVSLNQFSHHRKDVPDLVEPVGLDTTRQYHLECILKDLDDLRETSLNEPERRHSCGVNLECLAGYSDLLVIHPNMQEISGQLFSDAGPFQKVKALDQDEGSETVAMAHKDCCSIEYLAVSLAKAKLRLYAYDYKLHPDLAQVSELFKTVHSSRERNKLLRHFRDAMPNLGLQSKKELCFNFDVAQNKYLDCSQLLRIQVGISSLNADQQTGEFRDDLSRLLIVLCRDLSRGTNYSECMLSMQCVNMLLQKHMGVISQWHIDELLAAISVKASSLRTQTDKDSGRLYIGLCRSFGTLLATHRSKIGGRHHLMVLALQALLRCLFIPYKDDEAVESESSIFGTSHAAAYGRILNMICDPSVSSVKRSRNRSRVELNDETKRARSMAGQHLQYLIIEFCSCQLRGRLQSGMREALNAGLYAVLAVMPQDIMRTMNAAMDTSSRSVFKALYNDYRKVGKWNGG